MDKTVSVVTYAGHLRQRIAQWRVFALRQLLNVLLGERVLCRSGGGKSVRQSDQGSFDWQRQRRFRFETN